MTMTMPVPNTEPAMATTTSSPVFTMKAEQSRHMATTTTASSPHSQTTKTTCSVSCHTSSHNSSGMEELDGSMTGLKLNLTNKSSSNNGDDDDDDDDTTSQASALTYASTTLNDSHNLAAELAADTNSNNNAAAAAAALSTSNNSQSHTTRKAAPARIRRSSTLTHTVNLAKTATAEPNIKIIHRRASLNLVAPPRPIRLSSARSLVSTVDSDHQAQSFLKELSFSSDHEDTDSDDNNNDDCSDSKPPQQESPFNSERSHRSKRSTMSSSTSNKVPAIHIHVASSSASSCGDGISKSCRGTKYTKANHNSANASSTRHRRQHSDDVSNHEVCDGYRRVFVPPPPRKSKYQLEVEAKEQAEAAAAAAAEEVENTSVWGVLAGFVSDRTTTFSNNWSVLTELVTAQRELVEAQPPATIAEENESEEDDAENTF